MRTAESNNRAGHHPRKVIPYKEYVACKAAEAKALTASKPTLKTKKIGMKNCHSLLVKLHQGLNLCCNLQEDEGKLMVNQDPRSISVPGDSGHGTMAVTSEDDPVDSNEKLVGVVGGIDEDVPAENLSDVEWKEDNPLFELNEPDYSDAELVGYT